MGVPFDFISINFKRHIDTIYRRIERVRAQRVPVRQQEVRAKDMALRRRRRLWRRLR